MNWRYCAKTEPIQVLVKGKNPTCLTKYTYDVYTNYINFFNDRLLTDKISKKDVKTMILEESLQKMHLRIQRIKFIISLDILPPCIIRDIITYEPLPNMYSTRYEIMTQPDIDDFAKYITFGPLPYKLPDIFEYSTPRC